MRINDWINEKISKDVLEKKYFLENETFDNWLNRISRNRSELKQSILDKKFIFAGRILANRGTKLNTSYSNCTVISTPEDNMESIFDSVKEMALIYKSGLGAGIDLSKLRGRGTKVNNAAKFSSGSVSFMELFNTVTSIISQQGQNRQGALLITLDIFHNDILEFIKIKSSNDKIKFANISVKMHNEFMDNISKNEEIWKEICENNWDWGEPGILFWDRIKNYNLVSEDNEYEIIGVNACSEKPLKKGGTCNLSSINVSAFIKNSIFDWDDFEEICRLSVREMNIIIDESIDRLPLDIHRDSLTKWRNLGIGIIGLADAFIKMKIKYGSKESIIFCDKLMNKMSNTCLQESALESKKYGPYPKYKKDKILKSKYLQTIASDKTIKMVEEYGIRNCELLSIAPGGSISIILNNLSSGIEPHFKLSYHRKTRSIDGEDKIYEIDIPLLKEWKSENIDEEIPDYFITTNDVNPFDKIKLVSTLQKYVDSSISNTINLPENTSIGDIKKIYMEAYKQGLKGCTVFRENCSRLGILTGVNNKVPVLEKITESFAPKRPEILPCDIHYSTIKGTQYILLVGLLDNEPYEIFGGKRDNVELPKKYTNGWIKKNGKINGIRTYDLILGSLDDENEQMVIKNIASVFSPEIGDYTKVLSLSLRHGIPLRFIIDQLKKSSSMNFGTFESSCGRVLGKYERTKKKLSEKCPDCGGDVIMESGCCSCADLCGWSKCT